MFEFWSPSGPSAALGSNPTITLIAEANSKVETLTCELSTKTQILAGSTAPTYTASCDVTMEVYAYIGATEFGPYTTITYQVVNECFSFDPTAIAQTGQSIWTFNTGAATDFAGSFPLVYDSWNGATEVLLDLPRPTAT